MQHFHFHNTWPRTRANLTFTSSANEFSSLIFFLQPIGLYPGKYQFSGKPNLGDCSLNVLSANITFDDGVWQCQVTSSSFVSQDSLSSTPKRLVVRGMYT